MQTRPLMLVATLALLAGNGAFAADDTTPPMGSDGSGQTPPGSLSGSAATGTSPEQQPGSRFAVNSSRQVEILGMLDMDALIQDNYTDGNNNHSDHRGYGLLRAKLGAKVTLDEYVTAQIVMGYYNELGNSAPMTSTVQTFPQDLEPTQRRGTGQAVIDQAFVRMQDFLKIQDLGVDAGRMPFAWNLRRDQGGFLYDSRANDPAVTSWDGARASYNFDAGPESQVELTPYSYRLPDNSSLYGGAIDFKPAQKGSSRTFITGSVNLERNVVLRPVASNPLGGTGSKLITYYAGAEFELGDFDLYGEYAAQRGTQTGSITFNGWGTNAGIDWKTRLPEGQQFVLGIKGDFLSGDNNPTDNKNSAFINNWSGENDTYIVENPKYGQISHYLQGDLEDFKIQAGVAFDAHNRVRLNATYGYYRIPKPMAGSSSGFGQEADLSLTWQYTYYSTFRLFGGVFRPAGGFDAVAPAGPAINGTDPIYLIGLNLLTQF